MLKISDQLGAVAQHTNLDLVWKACFLKKWGDTAVFLMTFRVISRKIGLSMILQVSYTLLNTKG